MLLSSELINPTDAVSNAHIIPHTSTLVLEGLHFTQNQFKEIADNFSGKCERFEFGGGVTVDCGSGSFLGRICCFAKVALLWNVSFEDFSAFYTSFKMCSKDGWGCEQLIFGYETVGKYRDEIQEMGVQLGWRVVNVDEDCMMLTRHDSIVERPVFVKQSWKCFTDNEKFDYLKDKTELIEKKLDDLIKLVQEGLEIQAANRSKASSTAHQLEQQMNRLKAEQFNERHGYNDRSSNWF